MRKIKLTQGKFALVDDADYNWLNQWNWCAHKIQNKWYAVKGSGNDNRIYMHRLIMGLNFGDKHQVDHINHNGLNNRRCNLRVCTNQENHFNQRVKGIEFRKATKRWIAYIKYNYKKYHLGCFKSKKRAMDARKQAEKKYFGEFAYDN